MSNTEILTARRLRELLHYDPLTGVFTWRVTRGGTAHAGTVAGWTSIGYRKIAVAGGQYLGHRLAWLWMTGRWPTRQIDHKDNKRGNNAWTNLRQASQAQNCWNMPAHKDSRSGIKGVSYSTSRRKWVAHICRHRKVMHLGRFATKEEAAAAYAQAATRLFGEYART